MIVCALFSAFLLTLAQLKCTDQLGLAEVELIFSQPFVQSPVYSRTEFFTTHMIKCRFHADQRQRVEENVETDNAVCMIENNMIGQCYNYHRGSSSAISHFGHLDAAWSK